MSQFNRLLKCVKAFLREHDSMTLEERKATEFLLSFKIHGIKYIVGKGGINTMFYSVNSGERKVCYPDEMLNIIKVWSSAEFSSYFVVDKDDKSIKAGPFVDVADALKYKPTSCSNVIIGRGAIGNKPLYKCVKNLYDDYTWKRQKI